MNFLYFLVDYNCHKHCHGKHKQKVLNKSFHSRNYSKKQKCARKGNTDAVMSKLSDGDRKKINEVLADKEKLQQILNSDAAQKLMKILGGKQNG